MSHIFSLSLIHLAKDLLVLLDYIRSTSLIHWFFSIVFLFSISLISVVILIFFFLLVLGVYFLLFLGSWCGSIVYLFRIFPLLWMRFISIDLLLFTPLAVSCNLWYVCFHFIQFIIFLSPLNILFDPRIIWKCLVSMCLEVSLL